MSGEDDRPFLCSAIGCGMRFTNEDHMTVHEQKHEMSLALDVGTSRGLSAFVADQTPTPTKFLRNCEEIGLFQDLNKNPFDDAFKRATDAINGVNDAGMPGPSNLDTPILPSPFIARLLKPAIHEKSPLATSRSVKYEEVESPLVIADEVTLPTGKSSMISARPPPKKRSPPSLKIPTIRVTSPDQTSRQTPAEMVAMETTEYEGVVHDVHDASDVVSTTLLEDSGKEMNPSDLYILVNGQLIQFSNFVSSPSVLAESPDEVEPATPGSVHRELTGSSHVLKQRLKAVLTGVAPSEPSGGALSDDCSQDLGILSSVHSPEEQAFGASPSKRPRRGMEEDADQKRQHFLERNRAAAARCRNKRKMQIDQLERRCSDLFDNNKRLQTEVNSLKDEVASLKLMLISHKDCPVTKKQQEAKIHSLGDLCSNPHLLQLAVTRPASTTSKACTISIPATQANIPVPQLLQKIQKLSSGTPEQQQQQQIVQQPRQQGQNQQQQQQRSSQQLQTIKIALPKAAKVIGPGNLDGKFVRMTSRQGAYILPSPAAPPGLPIVRATADSGGQHQSPASWTTRLGDEETTIRNLVSGGLLVAATSPTVSKAS